MRKDNNEACATCPKPGACCSGFRLVDIDGEARTFWAYNWRQAATQKMAEEGLPFLPLEAGHRYKEKGGRAWVYPSFTCPKLGPDGRCTIYADRPKLCRIFIPKSDPLCVLYQIENVKEAA
jgi:Fe-S-cluster containining protein